MRILVFDTNPVRCVRHTDHCAVGGNEVFAYRNTRQGWRIHVRKGETWVVDANNHFDLVLLHDGDADAFTELGIAAEKCLRYSQGGTGVGVPWSVKADNPLDLDLVQQIISLAAKCKRQPVENTTGQMGNEQWLDEVRKLWTGVPDCLVAWALCEHVGRHEEALTVPEPDVKAAFDRLKTSLMADPARAAALQNVGWTEEVGTRLAATKTLIQAARRDL